MVSTCSGWRASLSTAADDQHQGIVVAYQSPAPDQFNGLYRHGSDDAPTELVTPTSKFGIALNLGVDRGDLYLVYTNPLQTGGLYLAWRRYLPESGLDAGEHVLGGSGANMYPTVRREVSDGQVDLAWAHIDPQAYDVWSLSSQGDTLMVWPVRRRVPRSHGATESFF